MGVKPLKQNEFSKDAVLPRGLSPELKHIQQFLLVNIFPRQNQF